MDLVFQAMLQDLTALTFLTGDYSVAVFKKGRHVGDISRETFDKDPVASCQWFTRTYTGSSMEADSIAILVTHLESGITLPHTELYKAMSDENRTNKTD